MKHGGIANQAEANFAWNIDQQQKTWIYQPRSFKLPAPYNSYRPDFFVVEDSCFYEIIATPQAFSYQREKIEQFRRIYPKLRLEIVNAGAWVNGPDGPRVSEVKRYQRSNYQGILVKLERATHGSYAARLAELMKEHGITSLADLSRYSGMPYRHIYSLTTNKLIEAKK